MTQFVLNGDTIHLNESVISLGLTLKTKPKWMNQVDRLTFKVFADLRSLRVFMVTIVNNSISNILLTDLLFFRPLVRKQNSKCF